MKKKGEQIAVNRQKRFEVMAVRLAHHLGLSTAETFDALPGVVREHFLGLQYNDIILPLVKEDHRNGMTLRQLANKYGRSKSTIEQYVKK